MKGFKIQIMYNLYLGNKLIEHDVFCNCHVLSDIQEAMICPHHLTLLLKNI
jgi:hypothetical protein